jgi:hypothetical protein
MSSRLMLAAFVCDPAVRRKRNADGAIFATMKVRDTDRSETRLWTVFFNDPELIERAEELRRGEPVAIAGPFSIVLVDSRGEPVIDYRITAQTFVDTRKRKSKTQKKREERVTSDEQSPPDDGGPNDEIPF